MLMWNPWHGCHKISPGCQNCYVYRRDSLVHKDTSLITKTSQYDLPVKRTKDGNYKLRSIDAVFTCGTSDFFLEEADEWRKDAWSFIRIRHDLRFLIITKRIERFPVSLPEDWGEGYHNVIIGSTTENQDRADHRIPLFLSLPIRHRVINAEPLLEHIEINHYLQTGGIEHVTAGGESGEDGRVCDYEWILSLRDQCVRNHVPFTFKQTGTHFQKNGKMYTIDRINQLKQAKKAGIDTF